jgi:hypothetical protein
VRSPWLTLLVAIGCSSSEDPPPPAPHAITPPIAPAITTTVPDPKPDAKVPERVVEPLALARAAHGFSIAAVTLAEDGTAAVTIDAGNHARLWPTLDGTQEPVVLPLGAPNTLALQRIDGKFAIASLDTAGGLVFLQLDLEGRLVSRASLVAEPPFQDVVAIARGFLAIRSDQMIELVDPDGARRGTLAAPPGARIVSLLSRRDRVLAMIKSQSDIRGQWVEIGNGAITWGTSTPPLDIQPETAVLSPAHRHLAAVQRKSPRKAAIVDLETGTSTPLRGFNTELVPLGFVADDRATFARSDFELSTIEWWDVTGKKHGSIGQDFELEFINVRAAGAGDQRVVGFFEQQLVMVSPKQLRYLGYHVHAARRLRSTPIGLVAELGGTPALLGDDLRAERKLRALDGDWLDTLPIDGEVAVAIDGTIVADTNVDDLADLIDPDMVATVKRRVRGLSLIGMETKARLETLPMRIRVPRLVYEPATRLLGINGVKVASFATFDPATHRFGAAATLSSESSIHSIALLDPALAGGQVAYAVHDARTAIEVRPVYADDVKPGVTMAAREGFTLRGDLEVVDRAGRLYVRETPDTIVIYDAAHEVARFTLARGWLLRPSPDAGLVAAFGQGRIALFDSRGAQRWMIGFPGVGDVEWSADGQLVVQAGGLAKIALDDGRASGMQCGWSFGLRNSLTTNFRAAATICD